MVGKPAGAVVDEQRVRSTAGGDKQVKVAVAVEIAKCRAGARHPRRTHAGLLRDVFELPVAEIFEQPVFTVETAHVNIAQPVAVNVARGYAGAVEQVGVHHARPRQRVGELDAGGLR